MVSRTARFMLVFNMVVASAALIFICIQPPPLLQSDRFDAITLKWGLAAFLIIFNALFIYQRFFRKIQTHIKAKTSSSEFLVSVSAIEESLERASECLPEIYRARVIIYKEKGDKPPLIRVSYTAYEDNLIPQVTEKLQQVVSNRFEQIVGSEMKPTFNITLARIVQQEIKQSREKSKESRVVDLSRGPVYPMSDDF